MKSEVAPTLREAIEQFYEENANPLSARDLSPKAKEFFRCHDTAHVVFGCDTSVFGEGLVIIFSIWGTTLGFRQHLAGYAEVDALNLSRQYSLRHLAGHIIRLIATAPSAFSRARRMSKPWPWSDHSAYLDRTLEDIRSEFNIRVIKKGNPGTPTTGKTYS